MTEIRDVLGLERDDLPDYSPIYKPFDRLKMWVWRALLRGNSQHRRLITTLSTARSSTVAVRRRTSASGREAPYRR
jgi:hypothetical protein